MKRIIITAVLVVSCDSGDPAQPTVEHEAGTSDVGELGQASVEPGEGVGSQCDISATATIHATVRVDANGRLNAEHDQGGLDQSGGAAEHAGSELERHVSPAVGGCESQCVREACGQVPAELSRLSGLAGGVEAVDASYANQLDDLAIWVTAYQQACHEALVAGGIQEEHGRLRLGTWTIPNSERWPALTGLSVDGFCERSSR